MISSFNRPGGTHAYEPYTTRRRTTTTRNNNWMQNYNESEEIGEALETLDDDDDDDEDQQNYTPIELPSRQIERERMPEQQRQQQSECFGCVYMGERNAAAIPYEDIMEIIDMARKSIGRTDLTTLALHMAKKYKRLRREINRNLLEGEEPLPPWNARTILDHIRHHNQDPEVQQVVILSEIQELREKALNACLEKDTVKGNVRCNKDQVACYEKLVKLQSFIQGKDPSKQAFYSGGAHIDPKVTKQGLLAVTGKNLVSYWQNVNQ